jgi:hypothetical protein
MQCFADIIGQVQNFPLNIAIALNKPQYAHLNFLDNLSSSLIEKSKFSSALQRDAEITVNYRLHGKKETCSGVLPGKHS